MAESYSTSCDAVINVNFLEAALTSQRKQLQSVSFTTQISMHITQCGKYDIGLCVTACLRDYHIKVNCEVITSVWASHRNL
jgi:hypothetical protein